MTAHRHLTSGYAQKGFTLLELLLSVGLLALLLSGMYGLFDSWMQRAVNRTAATDMLRVQNAAEAYVLANFEVFKADAANTFFELNIEDLKTFNYLPTGYQPRNAFRQSIRVFRRNIVVDRLNTDGTVATDSAGNPVRITTIEVVTVSDNPTAGGTIRVPNQRLLDTAQAGGPRMGVISNIVLPGATFANRVTSAYAEWWFDRAPLSSAGYNASPDAQGGYLAAYGLVNAEATDANDNWLYRVSIDGRPELNRMITDLLMNGNHVQNVGTINADRLAVTGNATFRGVTQGTASETAQAMTVEQALRLDSANDHRINMKDTSGGCTFADAGGGNRTLSGGACSISGGEVQVISENDDAIMTIGTMTAIGSVITDFTNVADTTDSAGISSFETVDGQNMTATDSVIAPTVNVTGNTVQTSQMQAAGLNVTNGASIGNQLVAASVQPTTGFNVTTNRMDVGNTVTLDGNIVAAGINATDTLYLEGATGGYRDTYLNRNVICTLHSNGRTYCEPSGSTYWPGGQFREDCSITGTGYQCWHYRWISGAWSYYGYCAHTRSVGTSGQAYHSSSCI